MKKMLFLVIFLAAAVSVAAEPVMRVGLMTDTHVDKRKASCRMLKNSLALFKKHNVDLIVNLGDIANVYDEAGYKNYRDTVKAVYGNSVPREIFVFANHDYMGRKSEKVDDVFKDVKKHLESRNDPNDIIKYKGYTFVVISQFIKRPKYIEMMEKAVKENQAKPIFVLDHVPAFDTVYHSKTWGDRMRRQILDRYPQAVQLSGHVHGTLTNELNIWQGKFTAVNAGSLQYWGGDLVGSVPPTHKSDMVMILEVYPDKLQFRRYFSTTGEEYGADDLWSVPLPFDPKSAPYTIAKRKAAVPVPEFAKDAKVTAVCGKDSATVSFPNHNRAFFYKVELLRQVEGKWQRYARLDHISEFMLPEAKRSAVVRQKIDIGYFDAGKEYLIKVTPVDFYGNEGKAISGKLEVKSRVADTVVFESRDPMKECPLMSGLEKGRKFRIDKDGYYIHDLHDGRLVFPDGIWEGKKGTIFRFTIEMETIQPGNKFWTLCLRNPKPLRNANNRIATEGGSAGVLRHVITFSKPWDAFNCYLLIREGSRGKIKFHYVKLERIEKK